MAPEWSEALALPDLEKLLAPISAAKPAGESLRYDPLFDEVRESRREEDPDLPQGVWKIEAKKAEWQEVESLCQGALESRTKDLQLAGWLSEAWVHRCGFEGAEHGLKLLAGLCESFWEALFPLPDEDGDLEPRLSPFEWVDQYLSLAVKRVPLTRPETEEGGIFCWLDWETALHRANRERARSGGALEDQADTSKFMISTSLTSNDHLQDLEGSLSLCRHSAEALVELLDERCGEDAPALRQLRETFEVIHRFLRGELRQRGTDEGDEAAADSPDSPPTSFPTTEVDPMDPPDNDDTVWSGGAIRSRAEAYRRLSETADYLARMEPHSPTPLLVRRAVSWGGMTVAELLRELLADGADLRTVFKLLGLPSDEAGR